MQMFLYFISLYRAMSLKFISTSWNWLFSRHCKMQFFFLCVCGWRFYIVDDYRLLGYEAMLFDNFCGGFRELHFYVFEVSPRKCFYYVT